LKVLIVTQYFWPENFKINDLALQLKNNGHEIDVLTGIPNYPGGKIFKGYSQINIKNDYYNGIKIYRSFILTRGKNSRLRLFLNYISFVIFGSIKIIRLKKSYDLMFVYEPSPLTVTIPAIMKRKITKIPVVLWVTDLWPESVIATINSSKILKKIIYYLLNPVVDFIYNNVENILVTSKAFIPSIKSYGIDSKKIIYFPQWAEPIFKPIKSDENLLSGINKESFKIMFAGNLGEAQDFPSILETAKILRNNKYIQWVILGDGRKKDWINEKIINYSLEDCFHMLGRHSLDDMPKYYANADAMLFSLKKEYIFSITIPAKVQTYLACGKPILAMIDGEAANIIYESKAGLVCPSGDSVQLSKNILKISGMSSQELFEMGNNSLNYYKKNYERKMLLDKVENIFSKVINIKIS